jgi:hypothetical protein
MSDLARAAEQFGVGVSAPYTESGREVGTLVVCRYEPDAAAFVSRKLGGEPLGLRGFIQPGEADFRRLRVDPYEVSESVGNLLTQAGWGRLLTLAVGGGGTAYASASTRIGVGTATAAATTGQTDLQAATGAANRMWAMVTGVGATGTGTGTARLSFVATVGTGDGNFAWAEWAIDQGVASGVGGPTATLLNRAVSAQGTKASGQTWTATALLDFT